jgi:hypothetical protein
VAIKTHLQLITKEKTCKIVYMGKQERLDLEVLQQAWDERTQIDLLGLREMWAKLDLLVPDEKQD